MEDGAQSRRGRRGPLTRALTKWGRIGLGGICSLSVRSDTQPCLVHDLTLLLHAQDLVEIDAGDRREGRARAQPAATAKRASVGGRIDLADEDVGRLE